MRTLCSPTHNDGGITTCCPPADLPLSEPASMFSRMFTNSATGNRPPDGVPEQPAQKPNADQVFGDVFEEVCHLLSLSSLYSLQRRRVRATTAQPSFFRPQLLRPEVERHYPLWTWLGAACGAGLGLVTGDVHGLVVGAYAGRRLGAIRDAKGKSVAAVFAGLSASQKVEVRRERSQGLGFFDLHHVSNLTIVRPAYRSCACSP